LTWFYQQGCFRIATCRCCPRLHMHKCAAPGPYMCRCTDFENYST
jgi:hypothetical protein